VKILDITHKAFVGTDATLAVYCDNTVSKITLTDRNTSVEAGQMNIFLAHISAWSTCQRLVGLPQLTRRTDLKMEQPIAQSIQWHGGVFMCAHPQRATRT